jgi:formylmethanofuran dehydrogenase subunit E
MGVRMAMAGLRELGIEDARSPEGMDLVIFTEIDRCIVDDIISVTGRTPGKRIIKIMDYVKTAATFFNAANHRAVRVSIRPDSYKKVEEKTRRLMQDKDEKSAHIEALTTIPEEELLMIRNVRVELSPQDLPGESLQSTFCSSCGEMVRDMREIHCEGKTLCRPCAEIKAYYEEMRDTA